MPRHTRSGFDLAFGVGVFAADDHDVKRTIGEKDIRDAYEAKFGENTSDIAVSADGDIYVLDQDNNRVRLIHDRNVKTVA